MANADGCFFKCLRKEYYVHDNVVKLRKVTELG